MSLAKTGSPLAPERFVSSAHWMQSLSEWDMAAARTHAERAARHFAQLGEQAAAATYGCSLDYIRLQPGVHTAAAWIHTVTSASRRLLAAYQPYNPHPHPNPSLSPNNNPNRNPNPNPNPNPILTLTLTLTWRAGGRRCIRLQPGVHTVAAWSTYGCSLDTYCYLGEQAATCYLPTLTLTLTLGLALTIIPTPTQTLTLTLTLTLTEQAAAALEAGDERAAE